MATIRVGNGNKRKQRVSDQVIDKTANKFDVSRTFAGLMIKYGCETPDEYRKLRKTSNKHRPRPSGIKRVKTEKTVKRK